MTDDLPRDGSWYIDCPLCRADMHVVGHNRSAEDDEPEHCPFCGRPGIEVHLERTSGDSHE